MEDTAATTAPIDDASVPFERPLFIPRALVVLASGWVFFSWVLLFGFNPPVQPQAASYSPSIQMLMMLIGVGIAIAWPMLRLSGRPSSMPTAQAALDGLSIFVLLQVVVWPLRLVTSWTLARAIAVDAAIAAAIMLTAGILASTQGSRSQRVRTAGMLVLVLLVLAPAIGAFVAPAASRDATTESDVEAASDSTLPLILTAPSAPALLSRCAEPSTIDPSHLDRGVLFRAFALGSAAWAVALGVYAARQHRNHAKTL